jgi:DNA polymerase-3 subunit delta'
VGFEQLVGQDRAVRVLRSALMRDRVAHSYLFTGPESVGKSTAARVFAQALNCEAEREEAPCGRCRSCALIERGNHPDVRVLTISADIRGRQRSEISIDQIRQNPKKPRETPPPLIHDAYLKPGMGRHKVYIIDPADRMSEEASNAVLKVLEEPPPHVVLILVSSEPASLLPTIVSRCQQVAFHLVGTRAIEGKLRELGLDPQDAAAIARLSGGRIAWAIRASQRPEVLAVRRALLDVCAGMIGSSLPAALRIAEEIKLQAARLAQEEPKPAEEVEEDEAEEAAPASFGGERAVRAQLPWCLEVVVSWYRDLVAVSQGAPLLNPDYERAMRVHAHPELVGQAECAVESILETKHAIERNANIDVALESLVLDLFGSCQ